MRLAAKWYPKNPCRLQQPAVANGRNSELIDRDPRKTSKYQKTYRTGHIVSIPVTGLSVGFSVKCNGTQGRGGPVCLDRIC